MSSGRQVEAFTVRKSHVDLILQGGEEEEIAGKRVFSELCAVHA
jgi:hypothetical protein